MAQILLVLLILLWFLGYLRIDIIPIPDLFLFSINGNPISLWDVLIFALVLCAVGIMPTPLRQIGGVILILWVLTVLGIISIAGISLASLLVIVIIVGLIVSLFFSHD